LPRELVDGLITILGRGGEANLLNFTIDTHIFHNSMFNIVHMGGLLHLILITFLVVPL
jgi:hypothetical protein